MPVINRINEGVGPIEIDPTQKKFQLDGVPDGNTGTFDVYGRNGSGEWGPRTDASLQTSGGGASDNFVNTSDYSTLVDAITDAQALNKPIAVNSVIRLDYPDSLLRAVDGISDGSVIIPFDPLPVNRIGEVYNINTTVAPVTPSGFTTYLGNELIDYSATRPMRATDAVDKGSGIVAMPVSVQRFSIGHTVRFNGTTNYTNPAGYKVVNNTEEYNDPNWVWILAPYVAETFTTLMSATRGLIAIPANDHALLPTTNVTVKNTGTYLDGGVYFTDLATDSWNPNEVVIEAFYEPTTFTQGTVEQAIVQMPMPSNEYTRTTDSRQRLMVEVTGSVNGQYDGTFPIDYNFSSSTLLAVDGLIHDATLGNMTGQVRMILTRIDHSGPFTNRNSRIRLSGFLSDNGYYNGIYYGVFGSGAGTFLVAKEFLNTALDPANQRWTNNSYTVPANVTFNFIDATNARIQVSPHSFFNWEAPINGGEFQYWEMLEVTEDYQDRTFFRLYNGMSSNPIHWGIVLGLNFGSAPLNNPAMYTAWNVSADSNCSMEFPNRRIMFSGWIVEGNVAGLGTVSLFGKGIRDTRLMLDRCANRPMLFNTNQGWHNYGLNDMSFWGNDFLNTSMHPQTPLVQLYGYNLAMNHCVVRQSAGGGVLCRPGQANGINIYNSESEGHASYGWHIHGFFRVSMTNNSSEQCDVGVLVSPSPNDTTWIFPDEINMDLQGMYLEALYVAAVRIAGVRNVEISRSRFGRGGGIELREWQGIGCVGCKVDTSTESRVRMQIDGDCRRNDVILPTAGSNDVIINDWSEQTVYLRPGKSPLELPAHTADVGTSFFTQTNPAALGGANVNNPFGDGIAKWYGSTIYADNIAYVPTLGQPSRFETESNGDLTIQTPAPIPDGTYYYRFQWSANPLYYVRIDITDTTTGELYSFRHKNWTSTPAGSEQTFIIPTYGVSEFIEIPFNTGGIPRRPRVRINYDTFSAIPNQRITFVWEYMNLTDNPAQGLVHVKNAETCYLGTHFTPGNASVTDTYQLKGYETYVSVDSSIGPYTISLPENPSPGEIHRFIQTNLVSNDVTLDGGSRNINGVGTGLLPGVQYQDGRVIYDQPTNQWLVFQ